MIEDLQLKKMDKGGAQSSFRPTMPQRSMIALSPPPNVPLEVGYTPMGMDKAVHQSGSKPPNRFHLI
jgi:hypothetical protein